MTTLREAVVEYPAGSLPCPQCGSLSHPIVFRSWAKISALLIYLRRTRTAAYMCTECARAKTTESLAYSGVLGWWSVPSIFWGPWAVYVNWRSAIWPPANPLESGAIPAAAVLAEISAKRDTLHLEEDRQHARIPEGSPLAALNTAQRDVVVRASRLYELLGVSPDASRAEIGEAYTAQTRKTRLDAHPGEPVDADRVIALNHAWDVLGDEQLRAAYDWLEQNRGAVFE